MKIIILAINKNFWINKVSKKIINHGHSTAFIMLVLALIVLCFLLKELTIVQILAASVFAILLIGFGMLQYTKEFSHLIKKVQKDPHILKRSWIYIIIWTIILLWGLKEILL